MMANIQTSSKGLRKWCAEFQFYMLFGQLYRAPILEKIESL